MSLTMSVSLGKRKKNPRRGLTQTEDSRQLDERTEIGN